MDDLLNDKPLNVNILLLAQIDNELKNSIKEEIYNAAYQATSIDINIRKTLIINKYNNLMKENFVKNMTQINKLACQFIAADLDVKTYQG